MSEQMNSGYCHITPGRLRVRVTNLKDKKVAAKSLELLMQSQPGVEHVRANPVTSNVLVKFNSEVTTCGAVLQSLADLGHLPVLSNKNEAIQQENDWFTEVGFALGKNLAKIALKQALIGTPAAILLELI